MQPRGTKLKEYKTKSFKGLGEGGDKEKQNETLRKPSGANEAKAILKTWLQGRVAGVGGEVM